MRLRFSHFLVIFSLGATANRFVAELVAAEAPRSVVLTVNLSDHSNYLSLLSVLEDPLRDRIKKIVLWATRHSIGRSWTLKR